MLQIRILSPTFGTVSPRMNAQALLQVLAQPSRLADYGMEELLELVRCYPYATNLRLLVLLKAKQSQDPDLEHYLNRFAVATFDRAHLYHVLEALDKQEDERGEVLELLELDELELADFGPPFEELPSRMNVLSLSPSPPVPVSPAPLSEPPPPLESSTEEEEPPPPARGPSDSPPLSDALAAVIPESNPPAHVEEFSEAEEVRPEDPERFAEVVAARRRRLPLEVRLHKLRGRGRSAGAAAVNSTVDHGAVVSETLAALLVRQGQLQHAIKMYRRLILLYPDKKSIFAGLIKELKEKL